MDEHQDGHAQRRRRDHLTPAYHRNSIGETAREGAEAMTPRAPGLRGRVLAAIEELGAATSEVVHALLTKRGGRNQLASIKPRCTELAHAGLICDTGKRGPGQGGGRSIVWRPTTPNEQARIALIGWQRFNELSAKAGREQAANMHAPAIGPDRASTGDA